MLNQVQFYYTQRQFVYATPNVVFPIQQDFGCNYSNRTNQIVFQAPPEKCIKLIDDCIPNEKNLFTIFVTNCPYNIDYSFFYQVFSQVGQIFQFNSFINKGSFYCTFADLRSLPKALKFHGIIFYQRSLKVNIDSENSSKLTSIVIIRRTNSEKKKEILIDEIEMVLLNFGKIYKIGFCNKEKSNDLLYAIFYDIRNAISCVDSGAFNHRDETFLLRFLNQSLDRNLCKPPFSKLPKKRKDMLLSRSQYRFHISSQVRFQNIPSQNNSYKKVLQFSKRSPVKDSVIYDFRKTHSHSQTR